MRKLLIVLLLMVMIPALAQEETETNTPTVPDLIGLTAPEAEALLNERGLRLDPILLSLDSTEQGGSINTIGEQSPGVGSLVEAGTIVSVSIIREYNLLLIYDLQHFADHDFTIINLSNEAIYIDDLRFKSLEAGRTFAAINFQSSSLDTGQCFQLWDGPESGYYRPPECGNLVDFGILRERTGDEQFWRETEQFQVLQDGIHRATCESNAGRCELWVSPQTVAEDVTEYIYFVYNEHELFVRNQSAAQWMPLSEIRLDNPDRTLNDPHLWSAIRIPDLDFLAPGECVYFADSNRDERLDNCFVIAESILSANNAFWQDGFTVQSLYQAGIERNCPAPSGTTFCLVPRYDLDS